MSDPMPEPDKTSELIGAITKLAHSLKETEESSLLTDDECRWHGLIADEITAHRTDYDFDPGPVLAALLLVETFTKMRMTHADARVVAEKLIKEERA